MFNNRNSFSEQSKYNKTSNNLLDTNVNVSIIDAIDFINSICKGKIVKIEKKFKKEIPVWKFNLLLKEGSSLEIELSDNENKLLQIEANEGPYEYEIISRSGFISFTSAKKIAEEHTSQKILKWNLKQVKNKFEYNFWLFTKSGKAQVRVDAETGEIITKSKNKKK